MAFLAACEWTRGGATTSVQAALGRYFITFGDGADGGTKLSYNDIVEVWLDNAFIHIRYPEGEARLDMQEKRRARRFFKKMEDAPSPLEVLGAKKGDAVAVVGLPESWVYRLLRRRRLVEMTASPLALDMLIVGVSDEASLSSIALMAGHVRRGGTLWVVYPRGYREISTDVVAHAGETLQLTGQLEVQISSRHSALKFIAAREQLVVA